MSDAYEALSKKNVLERTALDNALIFSRHGEVEKAAEELAELREKIKAYEENIEIADKILGNWRLALEQCLVFLCDIRIGISNLNQVTNFEAWNKTDLNAIALINRLNELLNIGTNSVTLHGDGGQQ